jgi:hypothetical protein
VGSGSRVGNAFDGMECSLRCKEGAIDSDSPMYMRGHATMTSRLSRDENISPILTHGCEGASIVQEPYEPHEPGDDLSS